MSNKKNNQLLDELIKNQREEIYYNTNIINFKELRKYETDLINSGEYLPNLIRGFIGLDYYSKCDELGVIETVLSRMSKTRKQGREADVVETINWIDQHQEYESILDEKNIKELGDKLEKLENKYKELQNIILN